VNVSGISGRLVKVPEFRFQGNDNDKPYCMIRVAVEKPLSSAKKKEFEAAGKPTADFFDVTCYDYSAKFLKSQIEAGNIKQGSVLEVTGPLEQRHWTQDGQKRSAVALRASRLDFPPNVRSRQERSIPEKSIPERAAAGGSVGSDVSVGLDVGDIVGDIVDRVERGANRRPFLDPEAFGDRFNPFLNPEEDGNRFNPFLAMAHADGTSAEAWEPTAEPTPIR
jgi:single-stranded DNA-binding protein